MFDEITIIGQTFGRILGLALKSKICKKIIASIIPRKLKDAIKVEATTKRQLILGFKKVQ